MTRTTKSRWLSLGEACRILGVNGTTLRGWGNTGHIRTFRTPGGHRRFSREDIYSLMQGQEGKAKAPEEGTGAPTPLNRMRRRIHRGGRPEQWLQRFDEEGRSRLRVLGRRLVTLALDYQAKARRHSQLVDESRFLGMDYGRELASRNVSLSDAVEAFIFFRNSLHEALNQPDDPLPARSKGPRAQMLLELEDHVLLGMASAIQQADPDSRQAAQPTRTDRNGVATEKTCQATG